MAGTCDTEQQRMIDRIKCIAFREARDGGATFINRQWIVDKIHRTTRFVSEWWEKSYDHNALLFIQMLVLSLNYEKLVETLFVKQVVNKEKAVSLSQERLQKSKKNMPPKEQLTITVTENDQKPFHAIPKPLKSETHISDRLWLCDRLKDWTAEDFLHLAPSDEFYIWIIRRLNYQNDRIWAKSIEDISEDERYREMVKNQSCIEIFIMFTYKRLL